VSLVSCLPPPPRVGIFWLLEVCTSTTTTPSEIQFHQVNLHFLHLLTGDILLCTNLAEYNSGLVPLARCSRLWVRIPGYTGLNPIFLLFCSDPQQLGLSPLGLLFPSLACNNYYPSPLGLRSGLVLFFFQKIPASIQILHKSYLPNRNSK
jgi:hypothetical protein